MNTIISGTTSIDDRIVEELILKRIIEKLMGLQNRFLLIILCMRKNTEINRNTAEKEIILSYTNLIAIK